MKIHQITFEELDKYNQIEMLKKFDCVREYRNLKEYTLKQVKPTVLDFAKEESMDLWYKIMNHETCGIFVIEEDNKWVAGVVVVTNSKEVKMLQGDMSNAVLWDIRVDSKYQNRGFGSLLFDHAVSFSKSMKCDQMIIETQNNNPTAIAFYEKKGATLLKINKEHYPDCPGEDQLLFAFKL